MIADFLMPIDFISYVRIDKGIDLILELQLALGYEPHVEHPFLVVFVFEADLGEFRLVEC